MAAGCVRADPATLSRRIVKYASIIVKAVLEDVVSPRLIKVYGSENMNNVVEQDHRAVKLRTQPMMGFTSFRWATVTFDGIETAHMIRNEQLGDGCRIGQQIQSCEVD